MTVSIADLLVTLATAIAAGGASIWAFLKFFGESWLQHHLAKDLERAKSEISVYAARRLKLHDKEYEVFPDIWSLLCDAKSAISLCLLEFRTLPDVSRMSDTEFREWVEGDEFTIDEQAVLLGASDRFAMLNRVLDFRNLRDAEIKLHQFQTYFAKHRIFLSPEIREKFDEIRDLLRKSWAAKKTDFRLDGSASQTDFLGKALDVLQNEIDPMMLEIEKLIQGKLFPESEHKNA